MTALLEPPSSPTCRTLKGESIRSLRELFLQASLSDISSPSPASPSGRKQTIEEGGGGGEEEKKNDNRQDTKSLKRIQEDEDEKTTTTTVAASSVPEKPKIDTEALKKQRAERAAHQVRMRLLQNLGIQMPSSTSTTAAATMNKPLLLQGGVVESSNSIPPSTTTSNSSERWGPSYTVFLNDMRLADQKKAMEEMTNKNVNNDENKNDTNNKQQEEQENDDSDKNSTSSSSSSTTKSQQEKKRKKLHFSQQVQVHPIPSHKVFSNRIKDTIWAGGRELSENVARNSLEFSYEDWNADLVLDEDTGLVYSEGEWIHPVHLGIPVEEVYHMPLSSDRIWEQTCERLGILPAECYHLPPTPLGITNGKR